VEPPQNRASLTDKDTVGGTWAYLGMPRACPRSIFLVLFARGQQRCILWLLLPWVSLGISSTVNGDGSFCMSTVVDRLSPGDSVLTPSGWKQSKNIRIHTISLRNYGKVKSICRHCIYMCMNFVHSCVWQLFLKNKMRWDEMNGV